MIWVNNLFSNHDRKEDFMSRCHVKLSYVIVSVIIVGCASTPGDTGFERDVSNAGDVDHAVTNEPVASTDYLDGAPPERVRSCRKEAPTGTRVERTICGPPRDDTEKIPLISSPPR